MMEPRPKWTAERVADRLRGIDVAPAPPASPANADERRMWHAAAVLSTFDPELLAAALGGEPPDPAALSRLLVESRVVYGERRRAAWKLPGQARRAALRELGAEGIRDMLKTLRARPNEPLQRMFEAWIDGSAPPLDEQSPDQLAATFEVARWLDGIVGGLPEPAEVRDRIEREDRLRPFRALVGRHFRGRERELRRLREHVDHLASDSIGEAISRTVKRRVRATRELLSLAEAPPLVIHGPGGMGKSTLLAKFILDHVDGPASARLPFVYLDFDRPALLAAEPITLLIDAARQIGVQFPALRADADACRDRFTAALAKGFSNRRPGRSGSDRRRSLPAAEREEAIAAFAALVEGTRDGHEPVLLVLDTFEEVQYRSRRLVEGILEFLDALQAAVPGLRSVIAGRAPVAGVSMAVLPLRALDPPVARAVLAAYGIEDEDTAAALVEQVGGNPLSLFLAAELARREGVSAHGIRDLRVRRRFFERLEQERIQGELYRRILAHIGDERVRRLAHPGLVLRRLTPELIRDVLAEPCGIEVPDLEQASELFDELRREVSLVSPASDGALRHRSDVREVMVDLLVADRPDKVREIHERAVRYYEAETGPAARAEELYHRLALGQPASVLDERWQPGIAKLLSGSLAELPPDSRAYLASRLGWNVDPEALTRADLSVWERSVAASARDLLDVGEPERVLELLDERADRSPDSPLHAIEAEALIALDRLEDADETLRAGIEGAGRAGADEERSALVRLRSHVLLRLGRPGEAERLLADVEREALGRGDEVGALEAGLARLRALAQDPDAQKLAREQRGRLARLYRDAGPLLYGREDLVVDAVRELGDDSPEVVAGAVSLLGLRGADEGRLRLLGREIQRWDDEMARDRGEDPPLARIIGLPAGAEADEGAWERYLAGAGPDDATAALGLLFDKFSPPPGVVRRTADLLLGQDDPTGSIAPDDAAGAGGAGGRTLLE